MGFEIALVVELGAKGVFQDPIGLANPASTSPSLKRSTDWTFGWGRSRGRPRTRGVLVQDRCVGLKGSIGSNTAGRSSYSTSMRASSLFRDVRIDGGDDRDLLADESHAIARQHRHVEHAPADQDVRQILGRKNAQDSGEVPGSGRVDPENSRVRQWLRRALPQTRPGRVTSPE